MVAGGMCGCRAEGVCVTVGGIVVGGGMCGCRGGMRRIRQDTINERAYRILLECILVLGKNVLNKLFHPQCGVSNRTVIEVAWR